MAPNLFSQPRLQQGTGGGGGGGIAPAGRISASVSLGVHVWTPDLTLSNITLANNLWNIQAEQPTIANLTWCDETGLVYPGTPKQLYVANYNWLPTGQTFDVWITTTTPTQLLPFNSPDFPQASWTWVDGSTGSPSQGPTDDYVSCQLTLETSDGGSLGQPTLVVPITVWRPYWQLVKEEFTQAAYDFTGADAPQVISTPNNYEFNVGVGDIFGYTVEGKSLKVGAGVINFCQLVNMQLTMHFGSAINSTGTGGSYYLDNGGNPYWQYNPQNSICVVGEDFPPPPAAYDQFQDSPAFSLFSALWGNASSWSVDYQWANWMMYCPNGGVFIPLTEECWAWHGSDSLPWQPTPPGWVGSTSDPASSDTFPEWYFDF